MSSTGGRDPITKVHAKTARGKRYLDSREAQVVEDVKSAIFLRTTKTSLISSTCLSDLVTCLEIFYSLKKPDAFMMHKKNAIHPFEGGANDTSLEFFSHRNNASFALIASHSKKRPDNIVITRFFDNHIMDMIELGIVGFKSISEVGGPTTSVGMKPGFVFNGELFDQREEYKKVQNILLDLFRGHVVEDINLAGLESVISVTATEDRILFRVYQVLLKKSGTRTPRVELELMGPSIDWTLGRTRFASQELVRQSLRKPKEITGKKEKNLSTTALGETMGRVHVGNQKLDEIQTRKMKALKKRKTEKDPIDNDE